MKHRHAHTETLAQKVKLRNAVQDRRGEGMKGLEYVGKPRQ